MRPHLDSLAVKNFKIFEGFPIKIHTRINTVTGLVISNVAKIPSRKPTDKHFPATTTQKKRPSSFCCWTINGSCKRNAFPGFFHKKMVPLSCKLGPGPHNFGSHFLPKKNRKCVIDLPWIQMCKLFHETPNPSTSAETGVFLARVATL